MWSATVASDSTGNHFWLYIAAGALVAGIAAAVIYRPWRRFA